MERLTRVVAPQGAQGEPGSKGERGDPGLPVRPHLPNNSHLRSASFTLFANTPMDQVFTETSHYSKKQVRAKRLINYWHYKKIYLLKLDAMESYSLLRYDVDMLVYRDKPPFEIVTLTYLKD